MRKGESPAGRDIMAQRSEPDYGGQLKPRGPGHNPRLNFSRVWMNGIMKIQIETVFPSPARAAK